VWRALPFPRCVDGSAGLGGEVPADDLRLLMEVVERRAKAMHPGKPDGEVLPHANDDSGRTTGEPVPN